MSSIQIQRQKLRVKSASQSNKHSSRGPRGPRNPKPQPAGKHRKGKGLLSTVLDIGEGVAGFLPGAIKGVRSMFNLKQEASFSTPASFATVQNNVTQMMPEQPVTHPSLGIAGMRVYGSQPLVRAISYNPIFAQDGPFGVLDGGTPPAVLDSQTVILNPILLAGPLSVYGFLYDRYVFRGIRIKYVTAQSTVFLGTMTMCIEKDIGNVAASSFQTCRQVTPNVTFPIRIPKAELDWMYDGPDLFYTNAKSTSPDVAQERQDVQSVLKGFLALVPPTAGNDILGFFDIEYIIDFFDPVPPVLLVGQTLAEMQALRFMRQQMAQKKAPPKISRIALPDGRLMIEQFMREDCPNEGSLTSVVDSGECTVTGSNLAAAAASVCKCKACG